MARRAGRSSVAAQVMNRSSPGHALPRSCSSSPGCSSARVTPATSWSPSPPLTACCRSSARQPRTASRSAPAACSARCVLERDRQRELARAPARLDPGTIRGLPGRHLASAPASRLSPAELCRVSRRSVRLRRRSPSRRSTRHSAANLARSAAVADLGDAGARRYRCRSTEPHCPQCVQPR